MGQNALNNDCCTDGNEVKIIVAVKRLTGHVELERAGGIVCRFTEWLPTSLECVAVCVQE